MTDHTAATWTVPGHLLAQGQGAESVLINLVPFVAIVAIMWFLLIAPMRKQQKQRQQLIENLKRGDQVITNGGVYGEVAALDEGTVHLKVADKTKIRVSKSAIAGLQGETKDGGS